MARPLRPQWKVRTVVRRRHRTWVGAMVFATLGWGTWWFSVMLYKLVPALAPPLWLTYGLACTFASRYRRPPCMSLDDADEVPEPQSLASTIATRSPRSAASYATQAP